MTDEPNSGSAPDQPGTTPEDAARKARMDELFGDLDDEETAETPDTVKAERDELRQKLADIGARLGRSQQDNLTLTRQLATQKEEFQQTLVRTERKFDAQKDFALEKFLKEVLPVVDNMERGLSAIPKEQREADPKFERLAQGIEKTVAQLTTVFNKFGIKEINPAGESFDPDKHEAIGTKDDPAAESETVLEVAQKGYELNGRVIRTAKVVVKP